MLVYQPKLIVFASDNGITLMLYIALKIFRLKNKFEISGTNKSFLIPIHIH